MAIADLKPEGFEDAHAIYARWTLRPSATAQGMWAGKYALWLEIESAGKTLLGYGYPEDALQEALAKLDELKAQATKSLADLRAAAGDLPSNDQHEGTEASAACRRPLSMRQLGAED